MATFGVDNTGLAFGGNPLSPGSAFGPIPSYADDAYSIMPLGLTKGMDPFSAVLGVANIGTSIAGMFGQQSAAEKQAQAVEEAAAKQAKAVREATKTGAQMQLAQVGLNFLESRYKGGPGAALDRINAARDYVQRANIEANNPSVVALRSVQSYEDRLRGAMPGYTPPNALFV